MPRTQPTMQTEPETVDETEPEPAPEPYRYRFTGGHDEEFHILAAELVHVQGRADAILHLDDEIELSAPIDHPRLELLSGPEPDETDVAGEPDEPDVAGEPDDVAEPDPAAEADTASTDQE